MGESAKLMNCRINDYLLLFLVLEAIFFCDFYDNKLLSIVESSAAVIVFALQIHEFGY